jgi:hypothetical protein
MTSLQSEAPRNGENPGVVASKELRQTLRNLESERQIESSVGG